MRDRKLVFAALLALATGCDGGQSGTSGNDPCACPQPPPCKLVVHESVPIDQDTPFNTGTQVVDSFPLLFQGGGGNTGSDVYLTWQLPELSGTTRLDGAIVRHDPVVRINRGPRGPNTGSWECGDMSVGVTVRLFTDDGHLDGEFEGTMVRRINEDPPPSETAGALVFTSVAQGQPSDAGFGTRPPLVTNADASIDGVLRVTLLPPSPANMGSISIAGGPVVAFLCETGGPCLASTGLGTP